MFSPLSAFSIATTVVGLRLLSTARAQDGIVPNLNLTGVDFVNPNLNDGSMLDNGDNIISWINVTCLE